MNTIIPQKLQAGDEVRVIAPSRSLVLISQATRDIATRRFAELGLTLRFGNHVEECDSFMSSSVASRVQDLHDAFLDPNVKGVITVIGGFNSNQLLQEIDWSIIQNNPKIFCGFSDITALSNAILAKTGLVTYSGLHYSSFGMEQYFDYCLDYFKKCLMSDEPFAIEPSSEWTDDAWFMDQNDRHPVENEGWLVVHEGSAEGSTVGGNLCTLNLLQGTEYMPELADTILFIEDDAESDPQHFDRDLVSLIQQPGFAGVKGIVIGRFQKESNMSNDLLLQIISSKKHLAHLPILANVDFGHTNTMITFPVGGHVELEVGKEHSRLFISKH